MTISQGTVTAILVTYNPDLSIFEDVISNISRQVNSVLLIDNASENADEIEKIISKIEKVNSEFLPNNIGLASAQNLAIKINENKSDYIILFDQDSIIVDGFVEHLVVADQQLRNEGVQVAAVGPTFSDPVNNKNYPATVYCGPFIKKINIESAPVEATFIIASGCLMKTSIFSEVGIMNDDFFIDYIDVEWCLRAKHKGFKVFVIPNAKMYHTIGDSRVTILGRTVSIHSPIRRYYLIRNSFIITRLNYIPVGYKIREVSFNFLRALISMFVNENKKNTFKYILRGTKDGIKGIKGKLVI